MTLDTTHSHRDLANCLRALAMDAVEQAASGHPGMPMGMADVATVLYQEFLRFNPDKPKWPGRDRLVLSAGHGSMLLYALLYLTGYPDITVDDIKQFRQLGAKTAGHPEYGELLGIETTTGPLGQGLANAVGMAIAERHLTARFGPGLCDHHTYVIAGDGCLMEGISHEAASLAGHLQLSRLVVLFDDNEISIDGPTSLTVSDDTLLRFASYGWSVERIDGHAPDEIRAALTRAQSATKPTLIACRTTIAYGSPGKSGKASSHGSPLGKSEIEATREALGWQHPPFVIPSILQDAWKAMGQRHQEDYAAWEKRYHGLGNKAEFDAALAGILPAGWQTPLKVLKQQWQAQNYKVSTREASGKVAEQLALVIPEIVGGSADLSGSNYTKSAALEPLTAMHYAGRYLYYGVREHAMAAIMNGLALYGGVIPYGGTFLVFSDYCRPAIRLSALMGLRVVYVMTHDSISLGEDGPTHQPIEHLSSLRIIPNLHVLRPADAVETIECWELAMLRAVGPSLLSLTRQAVPLVCKDEREENLCALGAYILQESRHFPRIDVTCFATGSEVAIALETAAILADQNIGCRVVSVPCQERFWQQESEYIQSLLCNKSLKVAIEAGVQQSWDKWIGPHGIFIGMTGFGASAPAEELYKHFGITAERVVQRVITAVKGKGNGTDCD